MMDPRRPDFIRDFDEEAARFLRHYGYEMLVEEPGAVPIRQIAEKRMMLNIIDTESLSPDESIQGAITFTDGIIDVFDWQNNSYVGFEAPKGTIFIDAAISNEGRYNNNLAHECFHWYKHRLYFAYRELHEGNPEFGFLCRRHDSNNETSWTDEEQMEFQARTIAPKILMPKVAAKKKTEELFRYECKKAGIIDRYSIVEGVIEQLADFFKVSKQSAAIRMTELGYLEAEVCLHAFQNEPKKHLSGEKIRSKAVRRQQRISIEDAFHLYIENESLREILSTGSFKYMDGYFVLNDPKYLNVSASDHNAFTQYATEHLVECTLDFSSRLIPLKPCNASDIVLYHKDNEYKIIPFFDRSVQNTDAYNHAKAMENIAARFEADYRRSVIAHESTTERFWKYIQAARWNTSIFQNKTHLAPMDYSRVQKPDYTFKIPAYVAMAVGLQLSLHDVQEALRLSGLAFDSGNRTHYAYCFLLTTFHGCSIDECNEVLIKLDVPELGTTSRK